jgi:putative DNA primase/helicase
MTTQEANSAMLDAAMHYARDYGIPVFPLKPHAKRPATAHGFKDGTVDADEIAAFWSSMPDANIGGRMGAGIVAIDFDVDADKGYDSLDWLAEWESDHGELPETARAITGREGVHLFYRVNRPVPKSENPDLHIDIRGDGSYVMMAPSVHPNGRTYEWECDPDEYGIADADANVYALIEAVQGAQAKDQERTQTDTRREPEGPEVIGEGGRNAAVFKQAASLRSSGLEFDEIVAALYRFNANRCKPPLSDAEVRRIASSVCAYPAGHSEEVQAVESARPAVKASDHVAVSELVFVTHGVCKIDGAPAARNGDIYETGWGAVNKALMEACHGIKRTQRAECIAYIDAYAPERKRSPYTLIGFKNGVFDLEKFELREYRDDDVITNQIPHDYDVSAQSEVLEKFMERIANGDAATMDNLKEVMGLCIMSTSMFGVCPVLLGAGSNGKSTYIEVVKALLGRENISALQPHDIGEKFQAVALVGKLANLGDDIANNYLDGNACSQIKKVATGNSVHTDVKNGEGFDFTPYATMIFSANEFPRLGDTTFGMLRRFHPIPFTAQFRPTDKDYDPDIITKLTSEEAMRRACVMACEGASMLMLNKRMTPNASSESIIQMIREDNNSILAWISSEEITRSYFEGNQPVAGAYKDYCEWCNSAGVKAFSKIRFNRFICSMYKMETARVWSQAAGKTVTAYVNALPDLTHLDEGDGGDAAGAKKG